MRNYHLKALSFSLSAIVLLTSACSSNGNGSGSGSTGTSNIGVDDPSDSKELFETLVVPVAEFINGAEQSTGIGNDGGMVYVLTNNQRVAVFSEEAELLETFEIPTLGSVSAQALSVEDGLLAVLDSQGQLYLKRANEDAVEVISYNYPVSQDFASLAPGENGDWLAVNRSGVKSLYTLEADGDLNTLALDSRLADYEIVGADVDNGRLFVLANPDSTNQMDDSSQVFELDSQGQILDAWFFTPGNGRVPSGLNVADPDTGEIVVAHSDAESTIVVYALFEDDDQ